MAGGNDCFDFCRNIAAQRRIYFFVQEAAATGLFYGRGHGIDPVVGIGFTDNSAFTVDDHTF